MTFMEEIEAHVRRVLWGRTRAESLALAAAEGEARRRRFIIEHADENGCFIVHDPHAWASYCEGHQRIVLPGEPDSKHLEDIRREIAKALDRDT